MKFCGFLAINYKVSIDWPIRIFYIVATIEATIPTYICQSSGVTLVFPVSALTGSRVTYPLNLSHPVARSSEEMSHTFARECLNTYICCYQNVNLQTFNWTTSTGLLHLNCCKPLLYIYTYCRDWWWGCRIEQWSFLRICSIIMFKWL